MHINEKIQMSYDKYINKLIEEKNYSERIFYDQTDQEYFLVYSFGITITQETTSTYKIHICFQDEGRNYHDVFQGSYIYDTELNNHELKLKNKYDNDSIDISNATNNFFIIN